MSVTKSYWHGTGLKQELYDAIWTEFVPMSGESTEVKGELVRIIGRIQHEYFNNGNINACDGEEITEDVEVCEDVYNDETGEWEEDCYTDQEVVDVVFHITDFYDAMLDCVVNEINTPEIKTLTDAIVTNIESGLYGHTNQFSEKNIKIYADWAEYIMEYVEKM